MVHAHCYTLSETIKSEGREKIARVTEATFTVAIRAVKEASQMGEEESDFAFAFAAVRE